MNALLMALGKVKAWDTNVRKSRGCYSLSSLQIYNNGYNEVMKIQK